MTHRTRDRHLFTHRLHAPPAAPPPYPHDMLAQVGEQAVGQDIIVETGCSCGAGGLGDYLFTTDRGAPLPGHVSLIAPSNYAGDVFAGLQRSYSYPSGSSPDGLYYQATYASPAGGWWGQATVGPVDYVQTGAPYSSIVVNEDMIVRLWVVANFGQVEGSPKTIEMRLRVNGTEVGSDDMLIGHEGLKLYGGDLVVDLRDYQLLAGDVVSVDGDMARWGNVGANGTYLFVVRGDFSSSVPSPGPVGP